MAAKLTFLDAGVLIAAFRGAGALGAAAREVVDDPQREFVASDMLRLELIPKCSYHGRTTETEFYEALFAAATALVETTPDVVRDAEAVARQWGLAAVDALHVIAAQRAGAEELVTTELPTKPIHRVPSPRIVALVAN